MAVFESLLHLLLLDLSLHVVLKLLLGKNRLVVRRASHAN
jgi:hypothetical protein